MSKVTSTINLCSLDLGNNDRKNKPMPSELRLHVYLIGTIEATILIAENMQELTDL